MVASRVSSFSFSVCLALAFGMGQLDAQETKPAEQSNSVDKKQPPWRRHADQAVAKNRISNATSRNKLFKRLKQPVLIKQQSVRDDQIGAVYMWIDDQQRPAAIVDAFFGPEEDNSKLFYFGQEFHSLYGEQIVGQLANGSRWRTGPGLEWELIPNQTKKPKSTKLMLLQTRKITAQLRAHGIDGRRGNQKQPYRVLRQPLYSYEVEGLPKGEQTMGCVFAICLGTDPEIIYSIEARTDAKGKTKWYESFAELSDMSLFVQRGGETIWSRRSTSFSPLGPHTVIMDRNVTLPEI